MEIEKLIIRTREDLINTERLINTWMGLNMMLDIKMKEAAVLKKELEEFFGRISAPIKLKRSNKSFNIKEVE